MILGYCNANKDTVATLQRRKIQEVYPVTSFLDCTYSEDKIKTTKTNSSLEFLVNSTKIDALVCYSVTVIGKPTNDIIETQRFYKLLLDKGIKFYSVLEPYLNSEVFLKLIEDSKNKTDECKNSVNEVIDTIISSYIKLAFENEEDLNESEEIKNARSLIDYWYLHPPKANKLNPQKAIDSKMDILKLSSSFCGSFSDAELIRRLNISRNSYYKYKKDIQVELENRFSKVSEA